MFDWSVHLHCYDFPSKPPCYFISWLPPSLSFLYTTSLHCLANTMDYLLRQAMFHLLGKFFAPKTCTLHWSLCHYIPFHCLFQKLTIILILLSTTLTDDHLGWENSMSTHFSKYNNKDINIGHAKTCLKKFEKPQNLGKILLLCMQSFIVMS